MSSWIKQIPGAEPYEADAALADSFITQDALKAQQKQAQVQYKAAETGLVSWAKGALSSAQQHAQTLQKQAQDSLSAIQADLARRAEEASRERQEAEARLAALKPPDILGRSGPAGDDSREGLPEAPLSTAGAMDLDTSSMGGVNNQIASAIGENSAAVEASDKAAWRENAEGFTQQFFRETQGREATSEEMTDLAPRYAQGLQTGFNMAGADVKGGADEVVRGIGKASDAGPRPAGELPPPPPVSAVRSDKFGSQPETQQLIEDLAADTKGFAVARGVDEGTDVKSLATQATERAAAAKTLDPSAVSGKASELARLRAEFAAMRDAATTVGDNFTARLTALQSRKAAGEAIDPAELGQVEAEFAQAKDLISEVFGMRAEGGRIVAENRRPAEGLDALRRLVNMVGGDGAAERLGEQLLRVDLTSPDEVAAILKVAQGERRLPSVGQMALDIPENAGIGSQPRLLSEVGYKPLVDVPGGDLPFETVRASRLAEEAQRAAYRQVEDVAAATEPATSRLTELRRQNPNWPAPAPGALDAMRTSERAASEFGLARQTEGAYAQAEEAHDLMADAWKGYTDRLAEMRAGLTPRELALADQAKQGYRGTAAVGPELTTKTGDVAGTQASLPGALEHRELPPILTMSRESAINDASKVFKGNTEGLTKWLTAWDQSADDAVSRAQVMQALKSPSNLDKLVAVTTANMLSGPKTLLVNAASGVSETINRPALRLLAWQPQEAATDVAAMGQAIGTAWARAGTALRAGIQPSSVDEITDATGRGVLEGIRPEAIKGKRGALATASLRVMAATDEFFYSLNHAGAMAVAAQRASRSTGRPVADILQNPPRAVIAEAEKAAREATFRGKATPLGSLLLQGRELIHSTAKGDARRRAEKATGLAFYVLTPFVRVPEEILVRGTKMLFSPATDTVKAGVQLARGNTGAARQSFAKAQLNAAVGYGIYSQVVAGNITGQGPASPEQRRVLEAARDERGNPVWQAHSIRIGDRWFDYTGLGPVAIPMAVISNGVEAFNQKGQKDPAWQEQAKAAVNGMADTILDASYLRTMGDLWKSVSERRLVGALEVLAANTANRLIPLSGLMATATRTADQTVKEPDGFVDRVAARLPIVSERVPSRIDPTTGKEVRAPVDVGSFLSPWRSSAPDAPNPVAAEVARLNATGESVSVPQLGKDEKYAGAKQSRDQRQAIARQMGQAVNVYVADLIGKPEYQALSDAEKAKSLGRVLGTAQEYADIKVGSQVARDERRTALMAWASVPHYAGVDEKWPLEKIREENWRIANAKALLSEYRKKYGERGEFEFYQRERDQWVLAKRPDLNANYLKARKDAVDKQYGGILSRDTGLLGAGNRPLEKAS